MTKTEVLSCPTTLKDGMYVASWQFKRFMQENGVPVERIERISPLWVALSRRVHGKKQSKSAKTNFLNVACSSEVLLPKKKEKRMPTKKLFQRTETFKERLATHIAAHSNEKFSGYTGRNGFSPFHVIVEDAVVLRSLRKDPDYFSVCDAYALVTVRYKYQSGKPNQEKEPIIQGRYFVTLKDALIDCIFAMPAECVSLISATYAMENLQVSIDLSYVRQRIRQQRSKIAIKHAKIFDKIALSTYDGARKYHQCMVEACF